MASAIEFDFATKVDRQIPPDEVRASCDRGLFCWLDLDETDRAEVIALLTKLEVETLVIDEVVGPDVDGRYDVYKSCLHIAVTSVSFKQGIYSQSHVDIIIGESYIVTVRRGRVDFIEQTRRTYRDDFVKFAKTMSFLLFEFWDHLTDTYAKGLRAVESEVEALQETIFGTVDDTIFGRVSKVTRELLSFRKTVLAAREVLHEVASRRSSFVSESAQPYFLNMVGTLERIGSDLAVEREILAETLNLYMSIVTFQTNKIVNRLAIVNTIFLPLTFLCGVYGMNFEVLPETKWEYGYFYFWGLAAIIAAGLVSYMRANRWL